MIALKRKVIYRNHKDLFDQIVRKYGLCLVLNIMQTIKQKEPQKRHWEYKLFSRSLKLLDAASPPSSKAKALIAHINTPLSPPKKTAKAKKKVPIKKERSSYLQEVDKMIKDYAVEKDIPVQIPFVIRRSSYKGYRITQQNQPQNTPRKSSDPGSPRISRKKRQKSQRKFRNYSLKQRIITQQGKNHSYQQKKSPTLPSIANSSKILKSTIASPLKMLRDPQLSAVRMKLSGHSQRVNASGLTTFQQSAVSRYMRFPTEV